MVAHLKRVVIDSLKPREITILDLSTALCEVEGVEEVDITVVEVDEKTETVKLNVTGSNVNYEGIAKGMSDHGASIRSIDEINVRKAED